MKRKREPDEEPRKPGRPQERVKLPLDFEEAVRDLIATGKPDDREKRRPKRDAK